jgi:hypothetical protein
MPLAARHSEHSNSIPNADYMLSSVAAGTKRTFQISSGRRDTLCNATQMLSLLPSRRHHDAFGTCHHHSDGLQADIIMSTKRTCHGLERAL